MIDLPDDMATDTKTLATDAELVAIELKARARTVMHWPELVRLINRLRASETKNEELDEQLYRIKAWCEAYPTGIFPEPDLKKARALLEAGGMTLDSISASSMRHVLKGIRKIIDGEDR